MNRREILTAASFAAAAPAVAQAGDPEPIAEILRRYDSFGSKRSGGPGDMAALDWLDGAISRLGYMTERQAFQTPFYEADVATLKLGETTLPVLPQPRFVATSPGGVEGRLVRWPSKSAQGAIVVVVLPYRRWSAFRAPEIEGPVRAALGAGAAGVVIVTTGPTGEVLALNLGMEAAPFQAPVVLIGSKAAAPLLAALQRDGATARLTVTGHGGDRPAYNLIGRLDRGAKRWLTISTPRSGWFGCMGERGGGLGAWLDLAAFAAKTPLGVNVALLSTSGHEYDNWGGHLAIEQRMPKPAQTALWVHLGANVASRDWHELGANLLPLPSADPQRLLVAQDRFLPLARQGFAGQPGLEAPYSTSIRPEGELKEILAAGYENVIGILGSHRFHHAPNDDLRCVEPRHIAAVAASFRTLIPQALRLA